jgi:hypothetical protein
VRTNTLYIYKLSPFKRKPISLKKSFTQNIFHGLKKPGFFQGFSGKTSLKKTGSLTENVHFWGSDQWQRKF